MTVHIVTDSSACVPADLVARHGIAVVPLQVAVDGTPAAGLSLDEVVRLRDQGVQLTTSAPTPGDFADAFDRLGDGEPAVAITVAASMSATHRSATQAAALVDRDVRVVDSRSAAGGHALVALAAARLAGTGAGPDEVCARAVDVAAATRLRAAVGSLAALAGSGRVPDAILSQVDRLHLHPIFEFREGKVRIAVPSVGAGRARERLLDACLDGPGEGARLRACVLHACEPQQAAAVADALRERAPGAEVVESEFEASMVIHTGPGLLGVAWWWDAAGARGGTGAASR